MRDRGAQQQKGPARRDCSSSFPGRARSGPYSPENRKCFYCGRKHQPGDFFEDGIELFFICFDCRFSLKNIGGAVE